MPGDPLQPPFHPRLGPEETFWAEVIRYEVDSWNPHSLPRRFRPPSKRSAGRWWGSLPQLAAVCVLLVLVLAALSGLHSNVAGVRDNVAGVHPAANQAGRGRGRAPASRDARPSLPSQGASPTRTGTTPNGTSSPGDFQLGMASGPRTISPAATAEPPVPTSSPPNLPVPSGRIPRVPRLSPPAPPVAQPGARASDEKAGSAGRWEPSSTQR
jgi:hypothetical protein